MPYITLGTSLIPARPVCIASRVAPNCSTSAANRFIVSKAVALKPSGSRLYFAWNILTNPCTSGRGSAGKKFDLVYMPFTASPPSSSNFGE